MDKWCNQFKGCGGSGICQHGRVRSRCMKCGGASICQHGRERNQRKECAGTKTMLGRTTIRIGRNRSSLLSVACSVVDSTTSLVIDTLG